jgi:hypothetical protein
MQEKEKQSTPITLEELDEKHETQMKAPNTPENNERLQELEVKEEAVQDEP